MAVAEVRGLVLKSFDYAEFDRRITLFTAERGKITVFARGVKRPGSRFMAATEPFAFGIFRLAEGKNAYTLREAQILNYFEGLRTDLEAYYAGTYFLEIADYYTRENSDDRELLKLLYTALLALLKPAFGNGFVRSVYEIKAIQLSGEYPGPPGNRSLLPGTLRSLQFILDTPPEKLFTFRVSPQVETELRGLAEELITLCVHTRFKSLSFLSELEI